MTRKQKLRQEDQIRIQKHKYAITIHFLKRLYERYSIPMSMDEYIVLNTAISTCTSSPLHSIEYIENRVQRYFGQKNQTWYHIKIVFEKRGITADMWVLYCKQYELLKTVYENKPVEVSDSSIDTDWNKNWSDFESVS